MTSPDYFVFEAWPTEIKEITQPFGANEVFNYKQFGLPGHEGIDIAATHGSPIVAVATGIVAETNEHHEAYGQHIRINHAGGFETLYAHLSKISTMNDMLVEAGSIIGYAGSTGRSTGPHLHLGLRSLTARPAITAAGYPHNIMDPGPFLAKLLSDDQAGEPIPNTGWVHTAYLNEIPDHRISSGTYGLTVREQPDKNSKNLGFLPAGALANISLPPTRQNGYIRIIVPLEIRPPHPLAFALR